jgi:NAD(P)H-dependent FMN reductase
VNEADALIFVVPEYNHSFPGLLKHVLDTNLKEYIHKAAGVCGVSAGPFGGARMIQNFLPVLREVRMTGSSVVAASAREVGSWSIVVVMREPYAGSGRLRMP